MEDKDVTFILQLGLIRDSVTLNASCFTLKTLKEAACDFVNTKVSIDLLGVFFTIII